MIPSVVSSVIKIVKTSISTPNDPSILAPACSVVYLPASQDNNAITNDLFP